MVDPTAVSFFLEVANTGALILAVWLFATGKIMSSTTVDTIMKSAEDRTIKLVHELSEIIEEAVYRGQLRVEHEKKENKDNQK